MTLYEAVRSAKQNKLVRRSSWPPDTFVNYEELCDPQICAFYAKKDYQDWEVKENINNK